MAAKNLGEPVAPAPRPAVAWTSRSTLNFYTKTGFVIRARLQPGRQLKHHEPTVGWFADVASWTSVPFETEKFAMIAASSC